MRGRKTELWEGGHRVPCFVRWPAGGLGEPRDLPGLAQAQDVLPTLLELCAITTDSRFDGISLAPALRGESPLPEDRMLVINYSRMPFGFEFAAPDSPSRMRRDGAAVLWERWRLLEGARLYDLESDPGQDRDVSGAPAEVVLRLRAHLDAWWDEVGALANEPQPVTIGHAAENPTMLSACEWLDVFIDQQRQIRLGERKNGWWELEVARPGTYTFELRRWPREADHPIAAGFPATAVTDGQLPPGVALPLTVARMKVGSGREQRKPVPEGATSVTFRTTLEAGRTRLYTWFNDASRNAPMGAYFVTVTRLE